MRNSVLSIDGAKYMCIDINNFYLGTLLNRFKYMRIPMSMFPENVIQQYQLQGKEKNGLVYIDIRKAIYGLPQAGALANKLLKKQLSPAGYYEVLHTPGLWRHASRPIAFTLVVDDFGVKYMGKKYAEHLVNALKGKYKISEDWTGSLYFGIDLEWDYVARTLDFDMPIYIKTQLQW